MSATVPVTIQTESIESIQNRTIPQAITTAEETKRFWTSDIHGINAILGEWDMKGYNSFSLSFGIGGNGSTIQYDVKGSNDLFNWSSLQVDSANSELDLINSPFAPGQSNPLIVYANRTTRYVRLVKNNAQPNQNATITLNLSSIVYPNKRTQLFHYPNQQFRYNTPTGGLTAASNLIRGASAPYLTNYITFIELKNAGTASTEIALQENATDKVRFHLAAGERLVLTLPQFILFSGAANINLALSTTTNVIIYAFILGFTAQNS